MKNKKHDQSVEKLQAAYDKLGHLVRDLEEKFVAIYGEQELKKIQDKILFKKEGMS